MYDKIHYKKKIKIKKKINKKKKKKKPYKLILLPLWRPEVGNQTHLAKVKVLVGLVLLDSLEKILLLLPAVTWFMELSCITPPSASIVTSSTLCLDSATPLTLGVL